jgi:hypothetical protein
MAMEQADDPSVTLLVEKHAEYIRNLDKVGARTSRVA